MEENAEVRLPKDAPRSLSTAGMWFEVVAEYEKFGFFRWIWAAAKELFLGVVTWGLLAGNFDPKRLCFVTLSRRDDGEPVATFSYSLMSEADIHVSHLSSCLATQHVFDFCRDLGIDPNVVVGPGLAPRADGGSVWQEVPSKQLRQRRVERPTSGIRDDGTRP